MRIACGELSGWFEKNATVVTPTPFLAAIAREQHARERLKQGLETWERPAIYSWMLGWRLAGRRHVMLQRMFPRFCRLRKSERLWHSIIEEEHPQLFDVSATVRLARSAATLLADWHISAEGEVWNEHADAQQFQHWHRLLRRRCRENGWVTRAELPRCFPLDYYWSVSAAFTAFVGFENNSPAFEAF